MFIKILSGIALVLAIILAYAATRPDSFRLQRSIVIKAPPEKAFSLLQDFHQWGIWSPWEALDPNMKRTFSGPASGVGSAYEWVGNKAGAGRMEILEAAASAKLVIKLDFIKPMEAHNITEFTLTPQGETTQLTWVMHGPSSYLTKVIHVFISMDTLVGKDFETGLANLKAAAEKGE